MDPPPRNSWLNQGVSLSRSGRDTGIGASGQVEGGVLAEAMKARRGMLQSGLTSASESRQQTNNVAPQAVQNAIEKTVSARELRQRTSAQDDVEVAASQAAHDWVPEWSDDEWAAE